MTQIIKKLLDEVIRPILTALLIEIIQLAIKQIALYYAKKKLSKRFNRAYEKEKRGKKKNKELEDNDPS